MKFIPVVNSDQKPLMPTIPSRARRWIKQGKATPFWKKGIFCVRLNAELSEKEIQKIAIGIDPGSKREAFTVKSKSHTYLNILSNTPYWVKDVIEVRRNMRKSRRFRKMPCRKPRFNRCKKSFLAPSVRARWDLKLRICKWLIGIYPITDFIVEDIRARTVGKKKWDLAFSPLQIGKKWFYNEIKKLGELSLRRGYETKELRDKFGLKKSSNKKVEIFEAHNIDSWVLANDIAEGHTEPDNEELFRLISLRFHRRQLHMLQPGKGGKRKRYGGTISLGLKRGSIVKHCKRGLSYIGGYSKNKRIMLHSIETGKRISQNARLEDIKILTNNSWRTKEIRIRITIPKIMIILLRLLILEFRDA